MNTILKRLALASPQQPPLLLLRHFSSSETTVPSDTTEQVYRLIRTAHSRTDLHRALHSTGVALTPDLAHRVLLRARSSHGNPFRALDFFNLAASQSGFLHSPLSLDTILYILGRSRRFDLIWVVLSQTRRTDPNSISPRTVQVVLARAAKVCSVHQTVDFFWRFKKLVPEFDVSCFNALLRTLCQERSMGDARNVYHSLKRHFRPNLQTFNVLLSGWRSIEEAESFFGEMREMGIEPDVVSYNCLVDVYCKSGEVESARKVFDEMRERDVLPDVMTYTSMIGGLGKIGQPDKAREVLREMREFGCYPDAAAYNAAIRNYCIAKRMGDAFGLMGEMAEKGLSPNATTYNLFFRVFYWSNDLPSSWRLYERMIVEGCLPNTQSCMFLIRLMRRREDVEKAMRLWGDMVERSFGAYGLVSDVLFDLLCDLGRIEEAERCFLEMVEMGHKPSHVSFRRIKVLLELANRPETVRNLEEKMESVVGPSPPSQVPVRRERSRS